MEVKLMFKEVAESRQSGLGADAEYAIQKALSTSWIKPCGTSFAGPGNLTSSEFQEALRTIYRHFEGQY